MENLDLSIYTVKGLNKMVKDLGIKGMSKAKRPELYDAISNADLSGLDLDSYEKKQEPIPEEPKSVKIPNSPRRSANPNKWRR